MTARPFARTLSALLVSAAPTVCALQSGSIPAASAGAPDWWTQTADTGQVKDAPFGPECAGFAVRAAFKIQRHIVKLYDASGAPQSETRFIDYSGALRNTVSGKTFPYHGRDVRIQDLQTGTITLIGLADEVDTATGRVVLRDTGIVVLGDNKRTLYENGPHPLYDGHAQQLCAALR